MARKTTEEVQDTLGQKVIVILEWQCFNTFVLFFRYPLPLLFCFPLILFRFCFIFGCFVLVLLFRLVY